MSEGMRDGKRKSGTSSTTTVILLAAAVAAALLAATLLATNPAPAATAQSPSSPSPSSSAMTGGSSNSDNSNDNSGCAVAQKVQMQASSALPATTEGDIASALASSLSSSATGSLPSGLGNLLLSPTISTSGTASTKVKPDQLLISAGVETNGTTAQQAVASSSNATAAVIAAIKGLGVADNQIGTSSYSLIPVYEPLKGTGNTTTCAQVYPPPPECRPTSQNIIGYRAINTVSVTLDVDGQISGGSVIDAAVKAGANNINGVSFFLSQNKQQQVRDSLIQDAIANARHRADTAAGALGVQVSGVNSVVLSDVPFPVIFRSFESASVGGAAVPTPILPGEQEVTMMVNITFTLSGTGAGTGGGATIGTPSTNSTGTSTGGNATATATTTTTTGNSTQASGGR